MTTYRLACSDLTLCIANSCPSNCVFFFQCNIRPKYILCLRARGLRSMFLPYASVLKRIERNINFQD